MADVALLLRRAGFGPTAAQVAAARTAGYEATVAALTEPTGPDLGATSTPVPDLPDDPFFGLTDPTPAQRMAGDAERRRLTTLITRWWLDRMIVADHQAREKLVFFWHGHWATSIRKVIRSQLMLRQYRTLSSTVDFRVMAHAMVSDPALVYWLDGQLNSRTAPNENLARELMELFILGIGNYTERDVKEAGRALTGWKIDYDGVRTWFSPVSHDDGRKTILGARRRFDAPRLVDHLLDHKACPRFLAARLWLRYGSSQLPLPAGARDAMVAAFPDSMAMLRALLTHGSFDDTAGTLVKQPVEWFVGAMRQLGLRLGTLPPETVEELLAGLDRMGQLPFAPPSVAGWPAGHSWLTISAAQTRLILAGRLAQLIRPGRLTPDDLAQLLAVPGWTDRTLATLKEIDDPRLMVIIGLSSPEYVVS
jgi:uncharacterized protein (DUF1800 family)